MSVEQGGDGRAGPGHSVLVVEDDTSIRDSLVELLEDEGYTVHSAENGKVALDKLRGGLHCCLILLDLMMPVMDGWAFRREQSQDPSLTSIPVVVLTAAGNQAGSIQASLVLQKPVRVERVLAAVSAYC